MPIAEKAFLLGLLPARIAVVIFCHSVENATIMIAISEDALNSLTKEMRVLTHLRAEHLLTRTKV